MDRIKEIRDAYQRAYDEHKTEGDTLWFGLRSKNFQVMISNGIPTVLETHDRIVMIYIDTDFSTSKIKKIEINWAAIGSTDSKTTKEFAELLQEAAAFTETLNRKENKERMQSEIDWQLEQRIKKYNKEVK